MLSFTVGETEYFVDEETYTCAQFERLKRAAKEGDLTGGSEVVLEVVRKGLGEEVFLSIPMVDFAEVVSKAAGWILFGSNLFTSQFREEITRDLYNGIKGSMPRFEEGEEE